MHSRRGEEGMGMSELGRDCVLPLGIIDDGGDELLDYFVHDPDNRNGLLFLFL